MGTSPLLLVSSPFKCPGQILRFLGRWLMLNSGLLSIDGSLRYLICMLENSQSDDHLKLSFSININICICALITGNAHSTICYEKLQGGDKELSTLIAATVAQGNKHQARNCWGRTVFNNSACTEHDDKGTSKNDGATPSIS